MPGKKLIEVALPLEKINAESSREKSIRHGHPSTLHLWWSRKPTATARAVIWSCLVDDPSAHPDEFPTEEEQKAERERLFRILEELVVWENANKEETLAKAYREITRYTNEKDLPELLDPFAGGGSIPLEAQRLGLVAHAHDLNPVAVVINKAMIEIPPTFAGRPPVNPEARSRAVFSETGWRGAAGLAEDVRYYGEWIKQQAFQRIGHLYPKVQIPKEQGGGEATVIAWIWARTVKCPNPVCGCEMPLVSSFVLSKKKGKEAFIEPHLDYEHKKISYRVHNGPGTAPDSGKTGRGAKFKCILCGGIVGDDYIKLESQAGKMGADLLAVVAEGKHGRVYTSPSPKQEKAALCPKPDDYPTQSLPYDPRNIWCVNYGLDTYDKLFTNRQLTALTTFSDLVREAQKQAEADAIKAGLSDDNIHINDGGVGAEAYGEAVGVYLAFVIDKMADYSSSICSWHSSGEKLRNTFTRQAIPMVWGYTEANPFCDSSGSYNNMLDWVVKCCENLPKGRIGSALQVDATKAQPLDSAVSLCTDPPYYDNIGYSDLSDFFYVWLRRSLRNTYPNLFTTLVTPKSEELIATPYRHDGDTQKAKQFFEDGMATVCKRIHDTSREDYPVAIFYAYRQSDTDENGTASTGWETMISAIMRADFSITGTWPIRTELVNRTNGMGTNALASSIVLVCRKLPENAPETTRQKLVKSLRREMRPALRKLQESNIAPVDMAQSAIGPGMAVFSRYRRVLGADGKPMSVREALQIINEEVDLYFNEQVGSLDSESRFCVDLYTQNAYNDMQYGQAEVLANAKSVSIPAMASKGFLYAKGGIVRILERDELPEQVDEREKCVWMLTQQLTRAMEKGGIQACAEIVDRVGGFGAENAKELAYRLYTIAERKNWSAEGYAYNSLVVSWQDIQSRVGEMRRAATEQLQMDEWKETRK